MLPKQAIMSAPQLHHEAGTSTSSLSTGADGAPTDVSCADLASATASAAAAAATTAAVTASQRDQQLLSQHSRSGTSSPLPSPSPSPPRRQPAPPSELQRAWERLWAGAVRGAVIGLTLRGGLHVVGTLLAAASGRRKRAVGLATAVEDTLRYAGFLASLAGVYIGCDEGIATLVGKDR